MTLVYRAAAPMDECLVPTGHLRRQQLLQLHREGGRVNLESEPALRVQRLGFSDDQLQDSTEHIRVYDEGMPGFGF